MSSWHKLHKQNAQKQRDGSRKASDMADFPFGPKRERESFVGNDVKWLWVTLESEKHDTNNEGFEI